MSQDIIITAAQQKKWESEAEALKAEIAERQKLLAEVQDKLRAAALLAPKTNGQVASTIQFALDSPFKAENLVEAMERIITTAKHPIAKNALRHALSESGFADPGAYFYTAIKRLADGNRITKLPDGTLWKSAAEVFKK